MADEKPQGKRSRLAVASMWLGIASCGLPLLLWALGALLAFLNETIPHEVNYQRLPGSIFFIPDKIESILFYGFWAIFLGWPILGLIAVIVGVRVLRNPVMDQTSRERELATIGTITGAIPIVLIIVMWFMPYPNYARESARRVSCSSNLKQIGLALRMYASDWDGHFPPDDGAKGLELLRSTKYLEDPRMYVCPSSGTIPAAEGEALTEEHADYHYRGGLTETDSPGIPVAWDKDRNHAKFGNVLFVGGHVSGFVGKNWQDNLGSDRVVAPLHGARWFLRFDPRGAVLPGDGGARYRTLPVKRL